MPTQAEKIINLLSIVRKNRTEYANKPFDTTMCGLNLIWDKQNKLDSHIAIVQMCEATAHRGPDEQQIHTLTLHKGRLFLGHNRLKIRDLGTESRQPYSKKGIEKYLLYNGELYGEEATLPPSDTCFLYHHLEEDLRQYSLAEVKNTLAKLNGMFAFVWIDLHAHTLLAARDAWHIKPLYYFENEQYLIISSEIKGILASGLVSKSINESQITPYLLNRFAESPQTFFKGIYQITSPIKWDLHTAQKVDCHTADRQDYTQIAQIEKQALIQSTEQALLKAISQQLAAKVPVGLFLSGGVDSTLLLALLQTLGHQHFPAFTLGNATQDRKKGTQDTHFAQQAAQQYGADLQVLTLEESCLEGIAEWATQLDQPIADPAAYLTYLLSQEASKSVKVVFSGAGADERFAGYHRHGAFQQYLKNKAFWGFTKQSLSPLLGLLPENGNAKYQEIIRQSKKFFDKMAANPQATFVNFTQMAWEKGLKEIYPSLAPTTTKSNTEELLRFALHYDQQHFLAQDVLALTDHAAMQHGLEVRVPYLDATLDTVLEQASATQIFGKDKKWLLKALLNQKGGQAYTQRRKEGFGFPFGHWLRKPVHHPIMAALLQKEHLVYAYLDFEFVRTKIQAHQNGKIDFSTEIWALWILKTWLTKHS